MSNLEKLRSDVALLAGMQRYFRVACATIGCGNPGYSGGVAMGAGQHRGSIGTSEPDWRGPVAAALGGLQHRYQ